MILTGISIWTAMLEKPFWQGPQTQTGPYICTSVDQDFSIVCSYFFCYQKSSIFVKDETKQKKVAVCLIVN